VTLSIPREQPVPDCWSSVLPGESFRPTFCDWFDLCSHNRVGVIGFSVSHSSEFRLQKPAPIESDATSHDPSPDVHAPSKWKAVPIFSIDLTGSEAHASSTVCKPQRHINLEPSRSDDMSMHMSVLRRLRVCFRSACLVRQ
jgi:hypothetical protein